MRYELLLQPPSADTVPDLDAVRAQLSERGAVAHADGTGWRWKLDAGELEVRPLVDSGVHRSFEVHVPLEERDALIRAAVEKCCALAAAVQWVVFDPQMMRVVTEKDADAVAAQFHRNAQYAGRVMGVQGALDAAFEPPPPPTMQRSTKVVLGILAFFFVLYWVIDFGISAIH